MNAFDLCAVTERLPMRDVEPEFGLIGLFEDETQLRDEFCTRSGDACCAIVRGDRRCTFCDLTAHQISRNRSRKRINETQNIEAKSHRSLFQLLTFNAHDSQDVAWPMPTK